MKKTLDTIATIWLIGCFIGCVGFGIFALYEIFQHNPVGLAVIAALILTFWSLLRTEGLD